MLLFKISETFENIELKMMCEICSSSKQEYKPLQNQHLEMLKKIDAINSEHETKSDDSKCICVQCEELLVEKYQTKLQQEAEQEKLQMQLEKEQLKEILRKLQSNLDDTSRGSSSSCNYSETYHEVKLKIEKSEPLDSEFIDINEFSLKHNTTMEILQLPKQCSDQEELNEQQPLDNSNSSNCLEAKTEIENLETMDIEDILWKENRTMKIFKSLESCYDEDEDTLIDQQQQFDASAIESNIMQNESNTEYTLNSAADAYENTTQILPKNINWNSLLKVIGNCFYCGICDDSSNTHISMDDVQAHILTYHYGYKYFQCTVCSRIYTELLDLGMHYKNKHDITMRLENVVPFTPSEHTPNYASFPNESNEISQEHDTTTMRLENVVPFTPSEHTPNYASFPNESNEISQKDIHLPCLMRTLNGNFYCCICGESSNKFMTSKCVALHIRVEHLGYTYRCTECKINYKARKSLKYHYKIVHNISKGKFYFKSAAHIDIDQHFCCSSTFIKFQNRFNCNECSFKYFCPETLKIHMENAHNSVPGSQRQTSNEPFAATTSVDSNGFTQKTVNATLEENGTITSTPSASEENRSCVLLSHTNINWNKVLTKINKSFYCNLCNNVSKQYLTKAQIKSHIEMDHYGYRYCCDECECNFKTATYLKNHYKRTHDISKGRINFKIVPQNIDCAGNPRRQLALYNTYRYECNECGIRFSTKIVLENHIQETHQIINGKQLIASTMLSSNDSSHEVIQIDEANTVTIISNEFLQVSNGATS